MQIPNLIKVDTISLVLDLLGDETKLGKRMKDLALLESTVGQMLKRYNDVHDIEQYLSAAQAKMAEAQAKEKQANEAIATALNKSDSIIAGAKEQTDKIVKAAEERANQLNATALKQDLREKELIAREAATGEQSKEAADTMAKAKALMAQADKLVRDYQERLNKLKTLAA